MEWWPRARRSKYRINPPSLYVMIGKEGRRRKPGTSLKSAQIDPNIRSGLYGVEVDPRTRVDDNDAFHAQFIPADVLKPRDLNKVGKQSAKMYPDIGIVRIEL